MKELKPCPFCGENPEKRFSFEGEYFFASISCPKCHIHKDESVYLNSRYYNPSKEFIEAEEKAIKKWNQRNGK